ncbi:hypothetical protein LTR99_010405 [Exophiala xenobiotica]|nr:hypothetical protein LTR72_007748 [Exophiala xenobiotica]KAK5530268.1 hypothetical protein LTR23_010426 [Chaetothyriales sp. CCFEE 6169]KAK5264115.1 hypothetical protein LTR96_010623 [Exophiala xenobiotica]KAK5286013.1 hypothetical protein LTR14_010534 [Exophiala xenobiotica]KAK5292657.1 hypothetical protein LTR99_010405 [Exophiala xenobiotica]
MLGDLIVMTPNATRVMSKWGNILPEVKKRCTWAKTAKIHDANGDLLQVQNMILENNGFPFCNTHRSYFQKAFYQHALSLGIKVHMGVRVIEYFETETQAGIIVEGVRHSADVVIGSDGVHSQCRRFVTGRSENPVSSGFAIYRAWLPLSALGDDPVVQEIKKGGDSMNAWIGPDVHCFVTVCEALKSVAYVITHKDEYAVKESWSSPGRVEDVLNVVKGWDPKLRAIVKATPKTKLIDWKLLWRDPLKHWVSDGGRVALSGDAAHPFLPSSGNGASQALEDSTTLATVLELAGKNNIPLALRAYESLRYERVCLAQRNGFETRHRWHKTNWKAFGEDKSTINLPQPDWLYRHDAESYTYDRWEDVTEHLLTRKPFISTNTYDGHIHEDWTVKGVMEMEKGIAPPPLRAKL